MKSTDEKNKLRSSARRFSARLCRRLVNFLSSLQCTFNGDFAAGKQLETPVDRIQVRPCVSAESGSLPLVELGLVLPILISILIYTSDIVVKHSVGTHHYQLARQLGMVEQLPAIAIVPVVSGSTPSPFLPLSSTGTPSEVQRFLDRIGSLFNSINGGKTTLVIGLYYINIDPLNGTPTIVNGSYYQSAGLPLVYGGNNSDCLADVVAMTSALDQFAASRIAALVTATDTVPDAGNTPDLDPGILLYDLWAPMRIEGTGTLSIKYQNIKRYINVLPLIFMRACENSQFSLSGTSKINTDMALVPNRPVGVFK